MTNNGTQVLASVKEIISGQVIIKLRVGFIVGEECTTITKNIAKILRMSAQTNRFFKVSIGLVEHVY